jgi:N-acetylmuramoyl-L-alanine amidase
MQEAASNRQSVLDQVSAMTTPDDPDAGRSIFLAVAVLGWGDATHAASMTARHRKKSASFMAFVVVLLALVAGSVGVYASVSGGTPGSNEQAPLAGTSQPEHTPSSPRVTKESQSPKPTPSKPSPSPAHQTDGQARRPPIVQKPIPFDAKRKAEMAAYAKRHYGTATWQLVHPHVIVEHYTAGPSFDSAFNTFAANSPDLGELPGTCAHFVIDTDGTIYQVVPLTIMCRHTVGLNYTAIGIEHVATSDQQVLRDKAQIQASLQLTLWLMRRYGISLPNVIGHNESLSSPYHKELVASWRCQTHADWNHADMNVYRGLLSRLAGQENVQISTTQSHGSGDAVSW